MVNKIPKIIHYCWFGKKDKPDIVNHCINSWKKVLDDYEIIEWNEDNFDININQYVREAYENKKFAFVSDYVRVYALYNMGGIYMDTDVEVIKSLDTFLNEDSFWGFEEKNYIATSTIGSKKRNKVIKMFLDFYQDKSFNEISEELEAYTNVQIITNIFRNLGFEMNGKKQTIDSIGTIYPQEYFSPYDYINCYDKRTYKTYTIHYFYKSWLSKKDIIKLKIKMFIVKIIGGNNLAKIRNLISRG